MKAQGYYPENYVKIAKRLKSYVRFCPRFRVRKGYEDAETVRNKATKNRKIHFLYFSVILSGLIGGYITKPIGMLTNMLYGVIFTAIGFASGAQVQSQVTMDWLFFIFTIFNAIGNLLICLPYLLIKLDKTTMAKVHAELEERRKAKLVSTAANEEFQSFDIYG